MGNEMTNAKKQAQTIAPLSARQPHTATPKGISAKNSFDFGIEEPDIPENLTSPCSNDPGTARRSTEV